MRDRLSLVGHIVLGLYGPAAWGLVALFLKPAHRLVDAVLLPPLDPTDTARRAERIRRRERRVLLVLFVLFTAGSVIGSLVAR